MEENKRCKYEDLITKMLVLIDRGSPYGSSIISSARSQVLQMAEAENDPVYIVSPCSHEKSCPLNKEGIRNWCHFSQRFHISKELLQKNGMLKNHKDCAYSYIVFRKGTRPESSTKSDMNLKGTISDQRTQREINELIVESNKWPRIIGAPMKRNQHVNLDLCHFSGNLQRVVVSKKEPRLIYKDARKSHWGDLWPHEPCGKVVIKGKEAISNQDDDL